MSYKQRLENLNLESLQLRRKLNILLIVFEFIHNFTDVPNIWKNIFKTKITRNGLFLELPKTRMKFCNKNFIINAIHLFNSLPICIRNESKLKIFKQNVKTFLIENIVID
jgi:hypothetical protein